MESVARSVSNNTKQLVEVNAKLQEQLNQGGGGGGDASAANQTLQLAQETIIAGDTTSIDSKITTGEDDTLLNAQQVLIYGRKDDSPSGLRAIKVIDNGAVNVNDGGLNGKISSGSDLTLTSAQQVVVYGRDSGGGLDALKTDNTGKLEVVLDAEQLTTTIFTGTQVIAGTAVHLFTTPLDKNGSTTFNLLISSSTTPLDIQYNVYMDTSDDDSTYYTSPAPVMNNVSQIANADLGFSLITPRYARFTIENSSLTNLTITSIKATRINGI